MEPASPSLFALLKTGDWLDRRRIGLLAAILLAVELTFFAFIVAGTHGWIVPLDQPCTTDFVSFYAAGVLADAGTSALAYDQAAHLATEEAITAPGIQYQYFSTRPSTSCSARCWPNSPIWSALSVSPRRASPPI